MNIFIINLDHEIQRKKHMEMEMKRMNISNYTFYKAIYGETELQNYSFKVMNNWNDYFKNRTITVGEIGCALSHWNLWLYIINNNIDKALILEDDVVFEESFSETLYKIKELDMDFDFLYLSRNKLNNIFDLGDEEIVNEYVVKSKYCFNMHSYIITLNGCKKLTSTKFLDMIIPIDEYVPIMYDYNYPFKQYSYLFDKFEKIVCYSLVTNITRQLFNSYKSSIDNSNIYYNMDSNLYKSWNIDLNIKENEKIELYNALERFFKFNIENPMDLWSIDLQTHNESFVEQLLYEIVSFNCKEFDIDMNDIYISFWLRQIDYNFDYSHIHVDHCDYELNKFGTINCNPLRTCILYIDCTDTPTIITDINKYDKENDNFYSSNTVILSFPKLFKMISFKSLNYHGECYLNNSEPKTRRAFIIGIWSKHNKPQYVQKFDITSFILWNAFEKIDLNMSYNIKNNLLFLNSHDGWKTIDIKDNTIINETFFRNAIVHRLKNFAYPLENIISKYDKKKYHTFIFDISKIVLSVSNKSHFSIVPNIDFIEFNNLVNKIIELKDTNNEYLLNSNSINLSIIDKFVYDIAIFHIKRLHLTTKNVYISWKFSNNPNLNNSDYIKNSLPVYSIVTNIDNITFAPVTLTSITNDNYKYKEYDNNVEVYFLKNMSQFVFNHNYISSIFKEALTIQLWLYEPNIKSYCGESSLSCEKIYTLTSLPLVRIIEKSRPLENICLDSNEIDIMDEMIYKKNINALYTSLKNINTDKDYSISFELLKPEEKNETKIKCDTIVYKKLEKLKFIPPK
jgi:GR25 family glycosyltransferase involved in LPS biosynthesis